MDTLPETCLQHQQVSWKSRQEAGSLTELRLDKGESPG